MRDALSSQVNTSLKYGYGKVIEEPGKWKFMFGFDRQAVSDCYGIVFGENIPYAITLELFEDLRNILLRFDDADKEWINLANAEPVLDVIHNYQVSKKVDNRDISIIKHCVKQKMDFINMLTPGLSKQSLVHAIYNPLHKKFAVNNRFQLLQKNVLDIFSFIMKLDVKAIVSKTKRVTI